MSANSEEGINIVLEAKLSFIITLDADSSAPLAGEKLRKAVADQISAFIASKGGVSVDDLDEISVVEVNASSTGETLFRP